ncbi:LysR family transcriptional regulator [Pseudoalteromonas sp. D15MCD-2]|uniref:LysR family transcriptional regulator n=1 Tax=Pseudoalteromonas TaxID=53246 RepID=UPI002551E061|nr:LysR family transcriptional regulator [Pseudoalteromonas shioyasakiensis]MDK9683408.1 LysR family transcriptional regulator [Pseudoalteromonas shioyasakiensis]
MNITHLPLNALRAFLISAKHLNFTKAAIELCVTQAAISQQVKMLEQQLGKALFYRLPRGLALTDEGMMLLPVVRNAFDSMIDTLEMLEQGIHREVVCVGAVGTFALNWLLPRIKDFNERFPYIDVRISTNNNVAAPVSEGLDFFIRYGKGRWHATEAERLFPAPLTVLCNKTIGHQLEKPQDILGYTLLRSYSPEEWALWFQKAHIPLPKSKLNSITFDSSISMVEAAVQGFGIALAPPVMFEKTLMEKKLIQPFDIFLDSGSYWLTKRQSQTETKAQTLFKQWILEYC